jgi:hypothetical protein
MSEDVTAPAEQEVTPTESPDDSVLQALEPEAEEVVEESEGKPVAASEEGDEPEESDEPEEGENEDEPSPVVLKYRGKTLEVPPGTAPEIVSDIQEFADYVESDSTRKYQEVAESRKALEQRQQQVEKLASLNDAQQDLYARGQTLKSEIARLQGEDMNALWQSDPDRARRISDLLALRQQQFQQTVNELSQTEAQFNQAREAQVSQQREAGRAVIEKVVPDFNPEPVIDYVVKAYADIGQDLSVEEAKANWSINPGYALIARKAMLYDQQQEKAKTIGKKPAPAPVKAPVTAPKGRGAAKASSVDLSDPAQMQKYLRG